MQNEEAIPHQDHNDHILRFNEYCYANHIYDLSVGFVCFQICCMVIPSSGLDPYHSIQGWGDSLIFSKPNLII